MARRSRSTTPSMFHGRELARLLTMIAMLAVLWMLIGRAKDPQTWSWLADDQSPVAQGVPPAAAVPAKEVVVAGPSDTISDEAQAAESDFEAVADRKPLAADEMPAYWRLMNWSRAQTFDELRGRAQRNVLYTQVWEQPDEFRGELIELRLHLRRALAHRAPENPAGVEQVYEAWGATDDSQSFPYLVVFSEIPDGMPLGAEINEEATFVGYFLKLMAYQAFDQPRAAPLLVGRLRWHAPQHRGVAGSGDDYFWTTFGVGALVLTGAVAMWWLRGSLGNSRRATPLTAQKTADAERWLDEMERSPLTNEQGLRSNGSHHRPAISWESSEIDQETDDEM